MDVDQLLSIDEVIEKCASFNENVTFIGDGTYKFGEKIKESLPNASIAPSHLNVTKASSIGLLGYLKLSQGESENVLSSAPVYLRKCQAEREYDEKVRKND